MPVHDQVHLGATAIAHQPAEEVDDHRAVEGPHKQPEPQHPSVGDGADMVTRNRLPVPLLTGVWPTGAQERPAAASEPTPISSSHRTSPRSRRAWTQIAGTRWPASDPPRPGAAPGPVLRLLRADPPAPDVAADRGAGQPHGIAAADQRGDRIAGPQNPARPSSSGSSRGPARRPPAAGMQKGPPAHLDGGRGAAPKARPSRPVDSG
jgi:hypothetical protein